MHWPPVLILCSSAPHSSPEKVSFAQNTDRLCRHNLEHTFYHIRFLSSIQQNFLQELEPLYCLPLGHTHFFFSDHVTGSLMLLFTSLCLSVWSFPPLCHRQPCSILWPYLLEIPQIYPKTWWLSSTVGETTAAYPGMFSSFVTMNSMKPSKHQLPKPWTLLRVPPPNWSHKMASQLPIVQVRNLEFNMILASCPWTKKILSL